jgi:nucleoside-diphosphate-sugar epimerase
MRVLVIGGTGLISVGIVKHLLARGAEVTVFNRGQRPGTLPSAVKALVGDRNEPAFASVFSDSRYDCVIDMICFNPRQAEAAIAAASGKCGHFIFCSTVCTYGIKSPPGVLIDEQFPQEPISSYGRDKVACEQLFLAAHAAKKLNCTIVRPSHTYGPGSPLIDNVEFDAVAWDRIQRGEPVLCAGDGLGLWVSTHRDDCGKLFAYGAMNPKTFGQSYNATRTVHTTWRDYYRQVAEVLGQPARLLFMPADWIVRQAPKRFGLLKEITAFHGAYDSSKAAADVPEFRCELDLKEGARGVFADQRQRGAWRDSRQDEEYQSIVAKALEIGVEPVEASSDLERGLE